MNENCSGLLYVCNVPLSVDHDEVVFGFSSVDFGFCCCSVSKSPGQLVASSR